MEDGSFVMKSITVQSVFVNGFYDLSVGAFFLVVNILNLCMCYSQAAVMLLRLVQ